MRRASPAWRIASGPLSAAGLCAGLGLAMVLLFTSLGVTTPAGAVPEQNAEVVGEIAFVSDVDGDYELFLMRPDGTDVRQLTDNEVNDYDPAWSPDGLRIVWEQETDDSYDYEDIYIMRLDSGRARRWIHTRNVDDGDSEWSPDGEWIAFRSNDGGDGADVVAVRVDKSRGTNVSAQDENSVNSYPTWSPDSKKLAFVVSWDGGDIFIARRCCSHGFKKRQITENNSRQEEFLDWSPDGSCILYARYQNAAAGDDLYAISPDGTKARPVLQLPGDQTAPAWSPDGSQIVFQSDHEGSRDIYVMNSDGSNMTALTTTPEVDEGQPAWWGPVETMTSQAEVCAPESPPGPTPSALP
jgi:Tol biopolymer transport system component